MVQTKIHISLVPLFDWKVDENWWKADQIQIQKDKTDNWFLLFRNWFLLLQVCETRQIVRCEICITRNFVKLCNENFVKLYNEMCNAKFLQWISWIFRNDFWNRLLLSSVFTLQYGISSICVTKLLMRIFVMRNSVKLCNEIVNAIFSHLILNVKFRQIV